MAVDLQIFREPPAVVHATHWKAGSQWIHRILHSCCPERIVTPGLDGAHLLGTTALRGRVYPAVYGARDDVLSCGAAEDMRVFFVMRDLRDTLVSWYFSFKFSHAVDRPEVTALRRRLQSMSVEDGMLFAIDDEFFARNAEIQRSWMDADVPVLKYEDLLERDEELLVPLLTEWCDLGVSDDHVREAIQECRFERLAGRARGVEDVNSHFRKGEAGEWRRHFTSRIAETFARQYGETLKLTGYAYDDRWVDDIEGVRGSRKSVAAAGKAEQRPFSVLMLLPDHRGHISAAIKSWTSQLYPDDQYELIVAGDGAEPNVEAAVRAMLRPNDRLMIFPGVKRSGLLDRAARASKFDQLVFTESHVEADSDYLRELNDWLGRHPDLAGACCRTMPAYLNNFAYFDGLLHEEGFRVHRADDDWRKINIHAFTLSRDWFVRAGGLDERYNLFAEMILAAKLRDLGGKMGYAPGSAVLHHFRVEVDGPEESVREFVRDESLYRRHHPGPDRLGFSALPVVSEFKSNGGGLWRSAFTGICRRGLLHRQTWRLMPQLAWNAMTECMAASGPRPAARRVAWRISWHKLAAQVLRWNRARLEPHYRELWRLYSVHERLLALADEGAETERWLNIGDEPQFVANDLEGAVIGLHDRENYMNQSFRWTQPISVWRLRGISAARKLHFRTHAVRADLTPSELTVCCNGKPVPTSQIDLSPDGLSIDLADYSRDPTKPTTLLLSIPALRPMLQGRPDRRALGLPVISVGLHPSAAWVQKSAA